MNYGLFVTTFASCALVAQAAGTAAWEMNSYQDFLAGRFTGISLSRDGRLTLAPKVETVFSPGDPVIWSVAKAANGMLYAGTGHRGRVFRIEGSGKSSVVWTAEEPEIFAVAVDSKGVLYAGTSPKGKVFRIENGKATEFFAPEAVYIWALAFGKDGALYVGTGDQGKVFRVEPSGKGEVYYETGQAHVTSLAFDAQGRLLAGSEPNGILYRIEAKDKAFVLYDADLPEIRAIAAAPGGVIYAAAMGGGSMGRSLTGTPGTRVTPAKQQVSSPATTITVTDDAQGGVEIKPKPDAAKSTQPSAAQVTAQVAAVMDLTGVEKSAIYKIWPDHTVETLWSSKGENIYDLLPAGESLVFSTDGQGRIYRLGADRKATLVLQTNEGEATRLLETPAGLLAATGDAARLLRLDDQPGANGVYEAPVHDAGTVARWGRLNWRGEFEENCTIAFYTRTGNSARPDRTWSDWIGPLADSSGSPVRNPNARYIQWKAEFSGSGGRTPVLESVVLAYLPQNTPPALQSIQTSLQASAATPATSPKQSATQPATSAFSITVTDTGEPPPPTSAGTPTQTLSRPGGRQLQITWQAEDRDGDRLVYALHFRGEDEREWKLVEKDLSQNSYQLDGDVLADGRYFFRVTASDLPSNPPESSRQAELVSAPVLVDNTPPQVSAGAPRWNGRDVEVEFTAADAAGSLRRAEYSLDATSWIPVQASDGVTDSPSESFPVKLRDLPPGEHLLVLRVYDAADNPGLAKVVLR